MVAWIFPIVSFVGAEWGTIVAPGSDAAFDATGAEGGTEYGFLVQTYAFHKGDGTLGAIRFGQQVAKW